MSFLVLVVDDEADVEMLFRQQFRRDLRNNRFKMDFARSGWCALCVLWEFRTTFPLCEPRENPRYGQAK
jgi:hypothetical protein